MPVRDFPRRALLFRGKSGESPKSSWLLMISGEHAESRPPWRVEFAGIDRDHVPLVSRASSANVLSLVPVLVDRSTWIELEEARRRFVVRTVFSVTIVWIRGPQGAAEF